MLLELYCFLQSCLCRPLGHLTLPEKVPTTSTSLCTHTSLRGQLPSLRSQTLKTGLLWLVLHILQEAMSGFNRLGLVAI